MKLLRLLIAALLVTGFGFVNSGAQDNHDFHHQEAALKNRLVKKVLAKRSTEIAQYDNYDALYYMLDLEPDPTQRILFGTVLMRAKVVSNSLNAVELNLSDPMVVSSITENGAELAFTHTDHVLHINLAKTYNQDEIFEIKITYSGRPQATGFGSFGFDSRSGKPMIWTLSEPFGARDWWPSKDMPEDKPDSVDIKITVPSELIVASNGLLRDVSDIDGGKKQYWWHESYPIATYLVSLAIHPYTTFSDWYKYSPTDSMEIQYYVFPDHYNAVQANYAKTKNMIRIFSELYGEYPFIEEKYGHAEFMWGGGMEHQTITSLGGWSESLIVHELAHMWWGDMITCKDFHHIWLNEGFATYSESLYWEKQYGRAAFHNYINTDQYYGPGTVIVEDPEKDVIFDGNLSYRKGAWVLHMLRHVVGDDHFFQILKTYYADQRYQYDSATTEDFQGVCEQVSGMDLGRYFQQWIYDEGFPVYEVEWSYKQQNGGTYTIEGFTKQVQTMGPIFWMPVDITIRMDSGDETYVHITDSQVNYFTFNVPNRPNDLIIDKDNWLLDHTTYKAGPSIKITGSVVQEMQGNGDGFLQANESGRVAFNMANEGAGISNLQGTLSTNANSVTITQANLELGPISAGQAITEEAGSFEFSLGENFTPEVVQFRLELSGDGNYNAAFNLGVSIGHASILVVEDDSSAEFNSNFSAIFDSAYVLIQDISSDSALAQDFPFTGYPIVIWNVETAKINTLTAEEQLIISTHIDNGGKFVLFGENIGNDLFTKGTDADKLFYQNVLHAEFESDNIPDLALRGIQGDIVGDGMVLDMRTFDNKRILVSPDVIAPGEGAVTFLEYLPSRKPAAIRHEDGEKKMAYFGIPLSSFHGRAYGNGKKLVANLVDWLDDTIGSTTECTDGQPKRYTLSQVYPNPFSSQGTIGQFGISGTSLEFSNPVDAQIEISVYNILGQKVKSLVYKQFEAGQHRVYWDGTGVNNEYLGSGVYIVRMKADNFSATRKILKLK